MEYINVSLRNFAWPKLILKSKGGYFHLFWEILPLSRIFYMPLFSLKCDSLPWSYKLGGESLVAFNKKLLKDTKYSCSSGGNGTRSCYYIRNSV